MKFRKGKIWKIVGEYKRYNYKSCSVGKRKVRERGLATLTLASSF